MEIWKDIPEYEGYYQVSMSGSVRSVDRFVNGGHGEVKRVRGLMLSPENCSGYYQVVLCKKNIKRRFKVHRLVAITFLPNPQNKPCINHKNAKRLDNRIENLEWVTYSENAIHAVKNNLQQPLSGSLNPQSKLTEIDVLEIAKLGKTINAEELGLRYSVSKHSIRSILRGDIWSEVTGIPKRARDNKRRLLENKGKYNYYTRKETHYREKQKGFG